MRIYFHISIIFLLLLGFSGNCQELSNEKILTTAQNFTRQFYSNELDLLHNSIYDKSFTLKKLKDFKTEVEDKLGEEIELYQETINHLVWEGKTYYGYTRHCKFSKTNRPVRVLFGFTKNKIIHRFEVTSLPEEVPSKFENYLIRTTIRPPFEGEWYVAAGGRSIMNNHHAVSADQRFAYDFVIRKNGNSFKNQGLINKDYYCFSKKILSPGYGIIVDLVNNIKDNKVGDMPNISGNRVIIDHKNGEYSVISHFKLGSIAVNIADTVKPGQYLGLCGNSGHSSEPHIHYHMQNSPNLYKGEGLPIQFKSYFSNSTYIKSGEPDWGERIRRE